MPYVQANKRHGRDYVEQLNKFSAYSVTCKNNWGKLFANVGHQQMATMIMLQVLRLQTPVWSKYQTSGNATVPDQLTSSNLSWTFNQVTWLFPDQTLIPWHCKVFHTSGQPGAEAEVFHQHKCHLPPKVYIQCTSPGDRKWPNIMQSLVDLHSATSTSVQ